MKITRVEYHVENNKPVIHIFQRDNGKRILTKVDDFIPYFYVKESEKDLLKGIRTGDILKAIDDTKVIKVFTTLPSDVPELREKYSKTWEADILFPIRWQIDCVDSLEPVELKTMFLDIETDNTGLVPDVRIAQEPITCITIYDTLSMIYTTFVWGSDLSPGTVTRDYYDRLQEIRYYKDEKTMLGELVDYISNEEPDVITGWNSDRFDLPYIVNRLTRLGIKYDRLSPMGLVYTDREKGNIIIKGVNVVDLYDIYRKFSEGMEESYKLDFIGKKVAGIGKTQPQSNVRWLWRYDIDALIDYNTGDVRITVAIDEKLKLIDFMDELRRLSYCHLEDCLVTTKMIDSYILRTFHGKKVFPTKTKHEKYSFEGAFVGSWGTGVYDNVVVFDLKSLYPSIIYSLNLSPECIVDDVGDNILQINGIKIRQDIFGFLPQVIDNLFKERARYKDLMKKEIFGSDTYEIYNNRQRALKTLLNALYGQTAYIGSRIYDARIAETTTMMGRSIIHWSKDFLENIGYKTLYCDTDSLSWVLDEGIDIEQIKYILGLLNKSYDDFAKQYGIKSHIFQMEWEKVYRKAFFGSARKRYAGHMIFKDGSPVDKLDVMGFEIRRSDSSQFSKSLQEEVFNMLLKEDKTKDDVLHYIGDQIDRIRKGSCSFSEIGIPKGMTRELDMYGKDDGKGGKKSIPANIRGAIYANKVLGYELSNKPKMLYISKMPNGHPNTDVLCFDEDNQVPPGTQINIEKMLEKLVKDKLKSIFEALDWNMRDLVWHWKRPKSKKGEQLRFEFTESR